MPVFLVTFISFALNLCSAYLNILTKLIQEMNNASVCCWPDIRASAMNNEAVFVVVNSARAAAVPAHYNIVCMYIHRTTTTYSEQQLHQLLHSQLLATLY